MNIDIRIKKKYIILVQISGPIVKIYYKSYKNLKKERSRLDYKYHHKKYDQNMI